MESSILTVEKDSSMSTNALLKKIKAIYVSFENLVIISNKFNSLCSFLGIRNSKTFEHISLRTGKDELHYNTLDLSHNNGRASWSTRIAVKNKDNTIFIEKSHLLEEKFNTYFKSLAYFQTQPIASLSQYLSFINLKVDIKTHIDPFLIFKNSNLSRAFRQCIILSGNKKIAVVNIIYLDDLNTFDIEYYIEDNNLSRYQSATSSLNEYCLDNFSCDYPKLIEKEYHLFDYNNLLLILLHISMKMKFSHWSFENDLPKTIEELVLVEMMEI